MVAGALWLLLFGTKPGTYAYRDGTLVPGDFTVVTYWEKWTKEEAEAMQAVCDRFNETVGRDKKIFVHFVSVSQVDQKTLIATAGGNPPDIAGIWGAQMGTFSAYNALTPLHELAADGTITRETYKPFIYELCAPGGVPYAASSTPAAVALYWNKELFREVGLDPEKPPQSIDELDAMADKLIIQKPDGTIVRAGFLPNFPGWWDYYWGNFFGNRLWISETDDYRIDTPEQVRAYTWYQKYAIKYGPGNVVSFGSGFGQFASPQNPFMSGEVAMCLQGPWFVNYVQNYTPQFAGLNFTEVMRLRSLGKISEAEAETRLMKARDLFRHLYGASVPPNAVGKPSDVLIGDLDVWAIPRGARNVKEAMEVIRFFSRQDNMEMLCRSHSKPSPLMKVSDEFIAKHPNPFIDVFETMMRSDKMVAMPVSANWAKVQAEITNANNAMWRTPDKYPVGPTLKETQIAADRHLAEYREITAIRKAAKSGGGAK